MTFRSRPVCSWCGTQLTVQHIFIDCPRFTTLFSYDPGLMSIFLHLWSFPLLSFPFKNYFWSTSRLTFFSFSQMTKPPFSSILLSIPFVIHNNILPIEVGRVWVQLLGGQEACTCVILILCECIWNAPAVSLVLPALDDTSSLGSPPHPMVYPPGSIVPPWVTVSHFLAGNREVELKPTTFSSLLLFHGSLSFLFS